MCSMLCIMLLKDVLEGDAQGVRDDEGLAQVLAPSVQPGCPQGRLVK